MTIEPDRESRQPSTMFALKRKLPEAGRLRASIILITLVATTILATSVWQIYETWNARVRLINQGSLMAAKTTAAVVQAQFEGHKDSVAGLAERADLTSLVESRQWETAEVFLEGLRGIDPSIVSAAILDAEGRIRARDPVDPKVLGKDFSTRDHFEGAMSSERAYVSNAFEQAGSHQAIVVGVSSAVRNSEGKPVGVLQSTIAVGRLLGYLRDVEVPHGGSVTIYDRSGQTVDLQDDQGRPHVFVRRALDGKAGTADAELPGMKGRRLLAYAPIPDLHWAVVVEQPRSVALRPVTHLIGRLSGIVILVVISGAIAGILLTRTVRQLRTERKEKNAILSSIAEGVVTIDPKGRIDSVNPAAAALVQKTEEQLVREPYHEAFPVVDPQGNSVVWQERPISGAIEKGRSGTNQGNLELVSASGRRVPVMISAAPLADSEGALLGAVAVIRDVTRERESDRLKSSFVSTVSHELRTPLTMIQGFSELLKGGELPEAQRKEAIARINVSSERLSRLIDDLLSVSRIDAGGVEVRAAPTDLAETVFEVISHFETEREIRAEMPNELPLVMADADKLIQVMTNLVSNAIKYSPSGAPVSVRAEVKGPNVEVAVTDKGIGLSDDDQAKLFDVFFRVDRPEVRQAGGNGLGLYITKNLVEMQGGKIWVRSNSSGSTFYFTIPVATASTEEAHVAKIANS